MTESANSSAINQLISEHKLPTSYLETVNHWLRPIAQEIGSKNTALHAPNKSKFSSAVVFGVQGAQGSGKSTCSEFFKAIFEHEFGLKTAVLSIDDFYLTHKERQDLSKRVHPLLATRGVPGTHDIDLTLQTINALSSANDASNTAIPRFDKAFDDRKPREEWDYIFGKVDIIILEGWFIGLTCPELKTLDNPINELEENEDPDKVWRTYVHQQLNLYQAIFKQLDKLLVLKAPSFDCIYHWRLNQEEKLIASLNASNNKKSHSPDVKTLSPREVRRFIAHFERLTEHALVSLPRQADWCLHLNENQKIIKKTCKKETPPFIIITDLDGTLLDHYTYSWEAALPAMNHAKNLNIPIIINTSKTRKEVEKLQSSMNITAPFIIENGSALLVPQNYYTTEIESNVFKEAGISDGLIEIIFGAKRSSICELVYAIRKEYGFKFSGYSDWDIEKLIQITGLDKASANLSMQRNYSEPIVWDDSNKNYELFSSLVEAQGYKLLKGGRFTHILGKTNKANPIDFLMNQIYDSKLTQSICLGDSPNDIDMLNIADHAICVKSPTGNFPRLNTKGITYHTEGLGPLGWNEAIIKILPKSIY